MVCASACLKCRCGGGFTRTEGRMTFHCFSYKPLYRTVVPTLFPLRVETFTSAVAAGAVDGGGRTDAHRPSRPSGNIRDIVGETVGIRDGTLVMLGMSCISNAYFIRPAAALRRYLISHSRAPLTGSV